MGRIYEVVNVNRRKINVLFDSGAVRSYIKDKSAKEIGLKIERLKKGFKTKIGGKAKIIKEYCIVQGKLRRNDFDIVAYVIDDLGINEKGEEIDLLFGATDMQVWNINLDLKNETLDLSRFRKEFIEYLN